MIKYSKIIFHDGPWAIAAPWKQSCFPTKNKKFVGVFTTSALPMLKTLKTYYESISVGTETIPEGT